MHCRIETNKTKLEKIESHVNKIENKIITKYDMTRETSEEYYKKYFNKNKIKIRIRLNKIRIREIRNEEDNLSMQ